MSSVGMGLIDSRAGASGGGGTGAGGAPHRGRRQSVPRWTARTQDRFLATPPSACGRGHRREGCLSVHYFVESKMYG